MMSDENATLLVCPNSHRWLARPKRRAVGQACGCMFYDDVGEWVRCGEPLSATPWPAWRMVYVDNGQWEPIIAVEYRADGTPRTVYTGTAETGRGHGFDFETCGADDEDLYYHMASSGPLEWILSSDYAVAAGCRMWVADVAGAMGDARDALGDQLLAEPLPLKSLAAGGTTLNPFDAAEEGRVEYCQVCERNYPTDPDQECRHLVFVSDGGGFTGAGCGDFDFKDDYARAHFRPSLLALFGATGLALRIKRAIEAADDYYFEFNEWRGLRYNLGRWSGWRWREIGFEDEAALDLWGQGMALLASLERGKTPDAEAMVVGIIDEWLAMEPGLRRAQGAPWWCEGCYAHAWGPRIPPGWRELETDRTLLLCSECHSALKAKVLTKCGGRATLPDPRTVFSARVSVERDRLWRGPEAADERRKGAEDGDRADTNVGDGMVVSDGEVV